MDLGRLRDVWNESSSGVTTPLREEDLMLAIEARQAGVREQVGRRLRHEVWNYAVPAIFVLVSVSLKDGLRGGLIGSAVVLTLLGALISVLVYKERQLSRAPLAGSLAASLAGLRTLLDSTARAYLAAYMAVVVGGLGVVAGAALWKMGVTVWSVGIVGACAAGVVWAFRSGQRYLERMFGRYRREIEECSRDVGQG